MWSSDVTDPYRHRHHWMRRATTVAAVLLLAACTVKPLNSTSSNASLEAGTSAEISAIMKSIEVSPVSTRVAQQVRNQLLFDMNGGSLQPGGKYRVNLDVTSSSRSLAVETDSLSPTSSQVGVTVNYLLIESETRKTVASGKRVAVASFDKTPQQFANERAERDAQNRAAKDVARQVHLAIAQALARL